MAEESLFYLYTDMVGSSRHWEQFPSLMESVLQWHDSQLADVVHRRNGTILHTLGDGICACFSSVEDAAIAAVEAQAIMLNKQGLSLEFTAPILLRMAISRATEDSTGLQSMGRTINLLSRLVRTANGGQILAAGVDVMQLRTNLPPGFRVTALGSVRLRDLSPPEEVWQISHDDQGHDFPPVITVLPAALSLPVQSSSFVGRLAELADLRDRIRASEHTRLITLAGFGGVGKTRLALQCAMQNADWFTHGVRMVSLAALHEPEFVPQVFASAFGVVPAITETYEESVCKALKPLNVLIIADNCEQLKDEVGALVYKILQTCEGVTVIATSREPLSVPGEQVVTVSSLALPPHRATMDRATLLQYDACRLLLDRAGSQHQLSQDSVEINGAIAGVCMRLDGIPLAIELAAARLSDLSIRELELEMDRRFQLLTGDQDPSTPHHRTLQTLVDWSYGLLEHREQVLLSRLAVFKGGFTLAAVENICTDDAIDSVDVLDGLSLLVDKSMVNYEPGNERYSLLETVQVFATKRLDESGYGGTIKERHLKWYSQWIDTNFNLAYGPMTSSWFAELDEELPNLRSALLLSLNSDNQEYGLNLASALTIYWLNRGMVEEGRRWIDAHIDVAKRNGRTRDRLVAEVLSEGASLGVACGKYDYAEQLMRRSLEIYRELQAYSSAAVVLGNLGVIMTFTGNNAEAVRLITESIDMLTSHRRDSNDQRVPAARMNLAQALWNDYQDEQAAVLLYQTLSEWRRIGNPLATAVCLNNLAATEITLGRNTDAWRYARECLRIRRQVGAVGSYAWSFNIIGILAADNGDLKTAAQLFGAASFHNETRPNARTPRERKIVEVKVAEVARLLGIQVFRELSAAGGNAELDTMVDMALSCGPGFLEWTDQ